MQSGIAVSSELHTAFNDFASDSSIFCLPVTITAESLTPLSPIRFSSPDAFYPSLPQLSSVLQPKTPLYLLFRRPESGSSSLCALTYIPSNAPVRAKTLFASTRATLVRELGSEKFATTVFATEEEEVVSEDAWRERDAERKGSGAKGEFRREDLMGDKERELEAVRRAEEEARSGTPGRDIGIGGSFARGGFGSGVQSGMRMTVDDDVKTALDGLQDGGLVQLVRSLKFEVDFKAFNLSLIANYELCEIQAIDIPSETFKLAAAESGIDANSVQTHISSSSPRYTFYHYPETDTVFFIYTCPSGSTIKERMLYASSRTYALRVADEQGLKISKKIEASSPDEISGDRLQEEVQPQQNDGLRRGFARPKRPGRTLASAVAVPEPDTLAPSPDAGLKRRNSSTTDPDPDSKRRRLSTQEDKDHPVADRKPSFSDTAEQRPDRRASRQANGRDEERKRGQRLFGALLGTLSQRSNTAAQKRRADIERKQQDKLKLQDEEYDELKKKKREERAALRKKEQRYYEEESMRTRHSNLLAMAHFLKTKSEPVLYYKPWQLRPEDEDLIRRQIEEAEATISRERAEFEARRPPQQETESKEEKDTQAGNQQEAPLPDADVQEPKDRTQEIPDKGNAETSQDQNIEAALPETAPVNDVPVSVNQTDSDDHRAADDDGGEVVEDNEDTVIY
ncbi:hypothetical protein CDV55_107641 [Aspergillus turcosus]|uniref:ADF-H domain-containing protein n=1 Tax=Aspergillus turcosus TaxID=1245748 RepID=A0A397IG68_9EURO|nr:hypothetical protein CDV55_107641 [Aspergillus turcosus]RLM00532.1 hypothetical protein CFD26_105155 [Aspergillus turcosus]